MSEFYVLFAFCLSCSFYILFVVWSIRMVIGVGYWYGSGNHGVLAVFAVNRFGFSVSCLIVNKNCGVHFFVQFLFCLLQLSVCSIHSYKHKS